MKDLYHQQGLIHYQTSLNCWSKRIYYSGIRCRQQDVCGACGHPGVRKNSVAFQKQAQIGALLFDKAPTEIPIEYSNYSDVFSAENAVDLLENTRINEYAMKLEEGKQLLFSPIYSLGLVELETLKIYIKINLANGFIRPFKSLTRAYILFNRKPDKSFCFYIDYWGLNNFIIKNWYLLPLIGESLDQLGRARRFT